MGVTVGIAQDCAMICSDRNGAQMVSASLITPHEIVGGGEGLVGKMIGVVAGVQIVQIIPSLFCDFLAGSRHRQRQVRWMIKSVMSQRKIHSSSRIWSRSFVTDTISLLRRIYRCRHSELLNHASALFASVC